MIENILNNITVEYILVAILILLFYINKKIDKCKKK